MMKSLFCRSCSAALTGVIAFSMIVVPQASANERHITCGSKNYGYNYCRVYTGGRVRLIHQLSHKSCSEGRTWGYDSQGVWVDKGCRADFVVDEAYGGGWNGGHNGWHGSSHDYHSSSRHDDNNIGATLGAAAGAIILGALIGGASGSDSKTGSRYNSHYDQRHSFNIPSWAIGTFQGHDPRYNSDAELTITPSGQVYAINDGRRLSGTFNGRELSFSGGTRLEVERTHDGLTTIQEGQYRNRVHYYRYR